MPYFKSPLTLCVISGLGWLMTTGCTNPSSNTQPSGNSNHPLSQLLGLEKSPTVQPIEDKKKLGPYSLQQGNNLLLDSINQTNDALIEQYISNPYPYDTYATAVVEDVSVASAITVNSSKESFSQTNLIEKEVDEADFVKQNANYIFLYGKDGDNQYDVNINEHSGEKIDSSKNHSNAISIYDKSKLLKDSNLDVTPVSTIPLPSKSDLEGLFLTSNKLYTLSLPTLSNNGRDTITRTTDYSVEPIEINSYDIKNVKSPKLTSTYKLDGHFNQARKIKNNLYVVTQSGIKTVDPTQCDSDLSLEERTLKWKEHPEKAIEQCQAKLRLTEQDLVKLMPKGINGAPINPNNCYVPPLVENSNGYNRFEINLTLINKIDLTSNKHQTSCVAGYAGSFYMNDKSMYLANTEYEQNHQNNTADDTLTEMADIAYSPPITNTIIHKFGLKDKGVTYAGTGKVDGVINFEVPSFSMNEYEGILRIVTSEDTVDGINNRLHTFKESDDSLELIKLATLPNKENPKSIGKPNERIKGVRFMGDQGYIVTFKNADPLYKIDLSDPTNPKMEGELEMPGYSAYLHQINDNYLMGIGYTVNQRSQPNGIQTTLFDVSSVPKIVAQDTVAIHDKGFEPSFQLMIDSDSKALSTVSDKGVFKVTIPYFQEIVADNSNQRNTDHNIDHNYATQTKALEYEIDPKTAQFINRYRRDGQKLKVDMYHQPRFRALIDGNDLFYATDDGIINKYQWGKP